MSQQKCPNCGYDNDPNNSLCSNCGLSLRPPVPSPQPTVISYPSPSKIANNTSILGPLPPLLRLQVWFRPPVLEGTVDGIQPTKESLEYRPEWTERVLQVSKYLMRGLFEPIVFLLAIATLGLSTLIFPLSKKGKNDARQKNQRKNITVLRMRVRLMQSQVSNATTYYEVFLMGDLWGNAPNLGDRVSLWGYFNRAKVLVVKHGYNHTTGTSILTRTLIRPWIARIYTFFLFSFLLLALLLCVLSSLVAH